MHRLLIILLVLGIGLVGARAQTPAPAPTPAPNSNVQRPVPAPAEAPDLNSLSAKTAVTSPPPQCSGTGSTAIPPSILSSLPTTTPIEGVSTKFPITAAYTWSAPPPAGGANVNWSCAVIALSDATSTPKGLQQNITAIVDKFGFPTNNCASYKPDNQVVALSDVTLTYDANSGDALLTLAGTDTVWTCLQNPVPDIVTTWVMKTYTVLGFTVKTLVPVVQTLPGSPIKTVLLTQPFNAQLFLSPQVSLTNPTTLAVGMQLSSVNLTLGGQYAFLINGVVSIAGVAVNLVAYDVLSRLIDLSGSIPNIIFTKTPWHVIANPSGQLSIIVWGY
jgi:hypothetical protein